MEFRLNIRKKLFRLLSREDILFVSIGSAGGGGCSGGKFGVAVIVLRRFAVLAFRSFSVASEGVTMIVGEDGVAPLGPPLLAALDLVADLVVRVETLSR